MDEAKYWERRRKNNLAAKKSRDARRIRENQLRIKVLCLENANQVGGRVRTTDLYTRIDRKPGPGLPASLACGMFFNRCFCHSVFVRASAMARQGRNCLAGRC